LVGGHCSITTVDRDGIRQHVEHTWSEDRIGELIQPPPIHDWKAWRRAEQDRALTASIPEGLSKVKRDMLAKKLRKGTLRAVAA
jgi:hypothetical protein